MKTDKKNVLFQRLGNVWYAFVEVDGELVYCALPEHIDPKTIPFEVYKVINEKPATWPEHTRPAERAA